MPDPRRQAVRSVPTPLAAARQAAVRELIERPPKRPWLTSKKGALLSRAQVREELDFLPLWSSKQWPPLSHQLTATRSGKPFVPFYVQLGRFGAVSLFAEPLLLRHPLLPLPESEVRALPERLEP